VAADPRYLDVWVPPGKRKSLPVETSGHAFAYVFEGGGTFRDASEPGAVRTEQVGPVVTGANPGRGEVQNRSLVLFDSGDAGDGPSRRRRYPVPARVGEADRGTGGVVRPHRDEHAGRATAGVRRATGRHLHQATVGSTGVPAKRPTLLAAAVDARDHVRGPADAPVTLVEYADFECPFCGRWFPELQRVLKDLGPRVRFVFRHFPISEQHPHAESAAEVAEAAAAQGKFWRCTICYSGGRPR